MNSYISTDASQQDKYMRTMFEFVGAIILPGVIGRFLHPKSGDLEWSSLSPAKNLHKVIESSNQGNRTTGTPPSPWWVGGWKGGRGVKMTTHRYSKTKRDRKARKKASIALDVYFRKSLSHFFAQVNIEVIRGRQSIKFSGVSYFFEYVQLSQNLLQIESRRESTRQLFYSSFANMPSGLT